MVASPSERENEVSTAKQRNLLCDAMSGIATVNEAKQSQLVGLDIRAVLLTKAAGLETNIDETVAKSPPCRHYRVFWDELVLHYGMEKNRTGHLSRK